MTAYDISNGSVIWDSKIPTRTSLKILPTHDRVFVGTLDTILVYDLASGKLLKTYPLPGDALSYSIIENHVYITFDNGRCMMAALDINTLLYDWCIKLSGSGIRAYYLVGPTENDIIYVYGDKLIALNRYTGEILWSIQAKNEFEYMTILNNHIYAVDAGNLFVFDKDSGKGVDRLDIPIEITNSIFAPKLKWTPATANDSIILFTDNLANGYIFTQ